MNPQMLIDPTTAGMPAPVWFVQFFKALGFTLHMIPMNLWYAGLLIALGLHFWGNEHGRRFSARLMRQMPIIIAFGINLGVVPLLFIQLAYYKVFYPATILMAWFWISIIVLLIPAYYGVYIYAWGLYKGRNQEMDLPGWKRLAGWAASLLILVIGFLFVNGMSLIDHVERWGELWKNNQLAGAALGTALNIGDPSLWPRWLLMFGLAMGTTAVWVLVDSMWLISGASEAYHEWAWTFAKKLYSFGMVWVALAGTWYVFGTWSPELRSTMFQYPTIILTIVTGMAMGLPWALMMTDIWGSPKKATAAAVVASQFGVLALNAVSRQMVQNVNLKPFVDIAAQPTDVQWGPLVMFLVVFVLGLGILAWMLVQVVTALRQPK
jgi:hypothetical protein